MGKKTDDPRRVVMTEMQILTGEGGEAREPLKFDLESADAVKKISFILKEGSSYKTQFSFRVQNEIVSGLKLRVVAKRMGMAVLKQEEMLGSYGPKDEPYTALVPRREWEEVPSGMMARAKYEASRHGWKEPSGRAHRRQLRHPGSLGSRCLPRS